jgi:hypothetical protein
MTKLIVTFHNFAKAPTNSSPARNGTPAVQLATLNAVRRLRGPHLPPVRGTKLLVAHFVTLRRRSLLPKCDRVSWCMSVQENAVTVHVSTTECHHGACQYNRMPSWCMSVQQNAVTMHVSTTECRHGACQYNRMPSTAFIVAKLTLSRQLSVKNT